MERLFKLEWYFSAFVTEVYKRMHLKTEEPWLTPDEMYYQSIQEVDPKLFEQIESFFESYEEWYKSAGKISQDEFKTKRKSIIEHLKQMYGE